ncbi:MAG: hypothetical protein WCR67_05935 [Bacilli bacterium]
MNKKTLLVIIPCILGLASCSASSTSTSTSTSTEGSAATSTEESTSLPEGSKEFIIEAEGSESIEDLQGNGFSGTATGAEMILRDTSGEYAASDSLYVSYLYKNGLTLEYTFNSTVAISGAKLSWRISGEFYNMEFSCTDCMVTLNNNLITYTTVTWNDIPTQLSGKKKAFSDYTLKTSCNIVEGENTLTYKVNNTRALGGTMAATSPMIDCFKLTYVGDAEMSWDPTDYDR